MSADLKPCPFCGSERVRSLQDREAYIGGHDRIVTCWKCGACGPNHYTEAKAVAAWNTRADPQQPRAETEEAR